MAPTPIARAASAPISRSWWHPDYEALPAPLRARIWKLYRREEIDTDAAPGRTLRPDIWPEPERSQVTPFLVTDPGPIAPEPWIRTPPLLERVRQPGQALPPQAAVALPRDEGRG